MASIPEAASPQPDRTQPAAVVHQLRPAKRRRRDTGKKGLFDAMNAVELHPTVRAHLKELIGLSIHTSGDRMVRITQARLAEMMGCSRKTAARIVRYLLSERVLTRKLRDRRGGGRTASDHYIKADRLHEAATGRPLRPYSPRGKVPAPDPAAKRQKPLPLHADVNATIPPRVKTTPQGAWPGITFESWHSKRAEEPKVQTWAWCYRMILAAALVTERHRFILPGEQIPNMPKMKVAKRTLRDKCIIQTDAHMRAFLSALNQTAEEELNPATREGMLIEDLVLASTDECTLDSYRET